MMRFRSLGASVLAITTAGCFATRNDVRILQSDVLAFRAEATRGDSARARQLASIMATLNGALGSLSDSVREVSGRLARFQGDSRQELRAVQEQLIQIQELTGQSQRRLQELRADMETRSQPAPLPAAPPAAPGDTTRPVATAAPAAPGPNQLFLLATQQRERSSYATARGVYQDLLNTYPQSELAPEAQYWIGETLNSEGRTAEADSTFRLMITQYPRAPKTSTAMYKLGLSLERQKKCPEAKAMMDTVARQFPQSDEASLVKDWRCAPR
jgi:tol-pal system protein YbgF